MNAVYSTYDGDDGKGDRSICEVFLGYEEDVNKKWLFIIIFFTIN